MATSYTSNKKIGALDSASTPLAATNEIVINQNGDILKTPLSAVEAKVFDAKTATSTPTGTEVVVVRQTDNTLRQVALSDIVPALNITTGKIADGAVTDVKVATINTAGKVTNTAVQASTGFTGSNYDNAVGADRIVTRDGSGNFAAGTVTASLSGNASTATTLQTGRTIALTGDVTGTTGSFNGSANVSAATTIANNAVTTAKIADDNVTFAKIQNSAAAGLSVVGRSAASAGDFAEINAATDGHALRRSGSSLGFGQIGSAGIATGAVTATELASNAVTTVKILDANVTGAKLENSGVAAGTYNDNAAQVRPFTVDAKGRVTAIGSAVPIALDYSAISGTPYKNNVLCATTANLTATYANGSSGVGATLTNSGTLGALSLDGTTASLNSRVLVKDQTSAAQNGIYTVTNAGSAVAAWVLTRAVDADTAAELGGAVVTVDRGTANGGKFYTTDFRSNNTVGTTALNWYQIITTGDSGTVSTAMIADANVTTAKIADANVTTAKVANDAIDNTKIRNSAALSVIGRSANSTGDPADIAAGTDGHVLRRSGTTLGFGQIVEAGIADNAVTNEKFRDSVGLSVIGRSASSTGAVADIAAATDGHVLRRSGTSIGFGQVGNSGLASNAVTNSKIADLEVTFAKLNLPSNFPIQVVQAVKTNTQTLNSDTWVDISGLSLTLTRRIASASGAVRVQTAISCADSHGNAGVMLRIVRGSTVIGVGDAAGSRSRVTGTSTYPGAHNVSVVALDFIDNSPGSTATVTYKIQAKEYSASIGHINRSNFDTDVSDYGARAISTLTLTELAP